MAGGSNGQQNGLNSSTTPQWLKGLQLGTQISQMGQRPQIQPQMPMQHPMMGGAPGMPQQGVVPGSVPQQPMQSPMANGGMGLNTGQQPNGGINPALLQMLMRSR